MPNKIKLIINHLKNITISKDKNWINIYVTNIIISSISFFALSYLTQDKNPIISLIKNNIQYYPILLVILIPNLLLILKLLKKTKVSINKSIIINIINFLISYAIFYIEKAPLTYFCISYTWATILSFLNIIEKKQKSLNQNTALLTDDPTVVDELGREEFVKTIATQIVELEKGSSQTFGLYAEWGEGKTSTIMQIEKKIKEIVKKNKRNDHYIFVNFDPWVYENQHDIIQSFYTEIIKALKKDFFCPSLTFNLKKYLKMISNSVDLGARTNISLSFDSLLNNDSIQEVKEKIEKHLLEKNIRLFINIDDIDRLTATEVITIFKLVRSNSNFKNTVFILPFDHDEVCKKLNKSKELSNPAKYLEKIVRIPITLPKVEQLLLETWFEESLSKSLQNKQVNLSRINWTNIRHIFNNISIRNRKRYINNIHVDLLETFIEEININDFLYINYIKLFHITFYDIFWENQKGFLNLLNEYYLHSSNINEYINKIRDSSKIDLLKPQKLNVLESIQNNKQKHIICDIWGYLNTNQSNNSLKRERSFSRYYLLNTPSNQISYNTYNKTLKRWVSAKDIYKEIQNTFESLSVTLTNDLVKNLETNINELIANIAENLFRYLFETYPYNQKNSPHFSLRLTCMLFYHKNFKPKNMNKILLKYILNKHTPYSNFSYVSRLITYRNEYLEEKNHITNLEQIASSYTNKYIYKLFNSVEPKSSFLEQEAYNLKDFFKHYFNETLSKERNKILFEKIIQNNIQSILIFIYTLTYIGTDILIFTDITELQSIAQKLDTNHEIFTNIENKHDLPKLLNMKIKDISTNLPYRDSFYKEYKSDTTKLIKYTKLALENITSPQIQEFINSSVKNLIFSHYDKLNLKKFRIETKEAILKELIHNINNIIDAQLIKILLDTNDADHIVKCMTTIKNQKHFIDDIEEVVAFATEQLQEVYEINNFFDQHKGELAIKYLIDIARAWELTTSNQTNKHFATRILIKELDFNENIIHEIAAPILKNIEKFSSSLDIIIIAPSLKAIRKKTYNPHTKATLTTILSKTGYLNTIF